MVISRNDRRCTDAHLPEANLPAAAPPLATPETLDYTAQLLLTVSAVCDGPFSPEDAAELLGEQVSSLVPSLEVLLEMGVLCWDGDMMAFVDSAERRAQYLELPEPLRMVLSRRIGRQPAVSDLRVARPLAGHGEGTRPDHGANVGDLDAAIRRVATGSRASEADEATSLELRTSGHDRRAVRSVAATRALIRAGRIDEAAELANQAVEVLADRAAVARLQIMLSTIGVMRCQWEEATSRAGAVLAEPGLTDRLYAEAKLAQLRSFTSEGNEIGMRSLVGSVMAGDERLGEAAALEAGFVASAKWAWDGGRPADAVTFLRAAVGRADRWPRDVISGQPRLLLAAMLASLGVEPEARILIDRSAERIRQTSDTMWAPAIPVQSAELALTDGRIDEAAVLAKVGIEQAGEQGTSYFSAMAWSVLAMTALRAGNLAEASAAVDRGTAQPPPDIAFYGRSAIALARARVAEAQGHPEKAMAVLSGMCCEPTRLNGMLLQDPTAAPWWVRVALAQENRRVAGEVVLTMEHLARTCDEYPSLLVSAAHARGLLDRDPLALQAAALGHSRPWAQASAAEDAGRMAGTVGLPEAKSCLEEARAGYERAGALRDTHRVERALRRLGRSVRRGRQGDRPVSGWASLTDAERRVAVTVAEGPTNLEAAALLNLSRHTVDFHLRQVFRKLNLVSRVELAWSVANGQALDTGLQTASKNAVS
jgi:DNA-binding CsgD family transcriptional regulator